jgi:hypothetical protein
MKPTGWRTGKRLSDTAQVDDDGFDTVSFALNLGLKSFHFIPVEGIGDVLFVPVLDK